MPKLIVSLAYGVTGEAFPCVEDGEGGSLDLGQGMTPRAACRMAARRLRAAAARLEMLGDQPQPFREDTHRRVNRAAVR